MQYPRSSATALRFASLLALSLPLMAGCGTSTPNPAATTGGSAGGSGGNGSGGNGTGGSATGGRGAGGAVGGVAAGGAASGGGPGGSANGGSAGSAGGRGGLGGSAVGGAGVGGSGTAAGGAAGTGGTSGAAGGGTGGSSGAGAGGAAGNAGGSSAGGSAGSQAGGASGSGGSSSGMCASAFFSTDAASRKATEYTAWKTAFVQECTSDNSAVVKNGGGVVSEGIGYGMLLSVNNDDRKLFDKLWKFYGDHLDPNGLMNWAMDVCTPPGNNNANAATDGDLDAAMGLVIADKIWGGYATAAKDLIGKIKKYETDTCANGLALLRPGDKWGGCTESASKGKTNPSYFAPAYYRVFATIDTANADFWNKLVTDSYTLLAQYQKAMNGLVPEWGFSDGSIESNTYDYNACRTPWRIAMDYMWNCAPEAKSVLEQFSKFVDGKGGVTKTGYANNSAFIGAFADSGIAVSQATIDSYVKDWLGNTSGDDTPYFQGTLRRLYLLVAGGQALSGR